jgi:hypothetical protein
MAEIEQHSWMAVKTLATTTAENDCDGDCKACHKHGG